MESSRAVASGQAEAAVDRPGAARDRTHRVVVADQLHRVWRIVTPRPVPLAGPRTERDLPLRVEARMSSSVSTSAARFATADLRPGTAPGVDLATELDRLSGKGAEWL